MFRSPAVCHGFFAFFNNLYIIGIVQNMTEFQLTLDTKLSNCFQRDSSSLQNVIHGKEI